MNELPHKGTDDQYDAIIAKYLELKDDPIPLDREELYQRYPEYAVRLREFFKGYDKIAKTIAATGRNDSDFPFLVAVDDMRYRIDDYLIDRSNGILGRGGMGIVYLAWDSAHSRPVAIKVMRPERHSCATDRDRFVREARSIAAIRHDNIVKIHHVDEKTPYFVMEYVKGKTLQQRIDGPKPLAFKEIIQLGMQIANGLGAAHKQGLTHRDLKPSNILLENGIEQAKITDFGLARHAYEEQAITQEGQIAGTWPYMAPEQACGKEVGHLADLFSFGSCLFAMCTREPPFETRSEIEQYSTPKHVARIRKINRQIPTWLTDVIRKLHARKPTARFQTADEVANLFLKRLHESPPKRVYRWALAAIIVVLLSGLGIVSELSGITRLTGVHRKTTTSGPKNVRSGDSRTQLPRARDNSTFVQQPIDASSQFTLLTLDEPERRFDSLIDAVGHSRSGDTIVILGNGPYVSAPISIGSKRLRIRAADGFQPVLELEPASTAKAKPLIDSDAVLVLEGLTLRRIRRDEGTVNPAWYLIRSNYAPLYIANCRFELRPKMDCVHATEGAGDCEIVNCVFESDRHAVSWGPSSGSTLVFQNSLQSGQSAVHLHCKQADLQDVTIRLLHNTLDGKETIKLFVRVAPVKTIVDKPFHVESRNNLIKSRDLVFALQNMIGTGSPVRELEDPAANLRIFVEYSEQQNRYEIEGRYLPGENHRSLEQWNKFWMLINTGSEEVSHATANQSSTNAQYVGPGEAYAAWKSTAEYQAWTERTNSALLKAK